jgi:hypothetical protein
MPRTLLKLFYIKGKEWDFMASQGKERYGIE